MLQQEGKYLYFAADITGGQDDQINTLELMITIALSLQRILIIKETESAVHHRTSIRYIPFHWSSYIDLARTKIAEIIPDGTIKEVQSSLRWVHKKDFNFKAYSGEQIRTINISQLYNPEYTLTPVLCVTGTKNPDYRNIVVDASNMRIHCKALHHITLSPSSKVEDLTDIVLARFGTDRKSSLYAQASLNFKVRVRKHDFRFNYYMCMHIRGGDILQYDKSYYFSAQKEQINHIVEAVYARHSSKIPIYIMSNMDLSYFDFLKPKYEIYTYKDFPKLKKLFVSKYASVDHNLLYAVEKNIMRYALVKIMPPNRNWLVFDLDASYKIPPYINTSFDPAKIRRKEWRIITFINKINHRLRTKLEKKFGIKFQS